MVLSLYNATPRRILIFGSTGLLGSKLLQILYDKHAVICPTRSDFKIDDPQRLKFLVNLHSPDIVINCIAFTNVELAETQKEIAEEVNVNFIDRLTTILSEVQIPLLHFSTDYVFNSEFPHQFKEDDVTRPINHYGKTKLAGEDLIRKRLERFFIIRTAWLYGAKKKNFFCFIKNYNPENPLYIVNDQFGNPTSVDLVAEATLKLLQRYFTNTTNDASTYHITTDGTASWYDFTSHINKQLGLRLDITPISSKQFKEKMGTLASRPNYSSLDNSKFISVFKYDLPKWELCFEEFLKGN